MKKMSHAREIQIQKLQTKNRMVGQTFNPSGITSEQIEERELVFVLEWREKTLTERTEYWQNVKEILSSFKANKIHCSWDWTWCVFQRHFTFNGQVY